MNTVSGIANSARSGWDRMVRPSMPFGHRAPTTDIHPQPFKRTSVTNTSTSPAPHPNSSVTLSCSVPFNSELSGPKRDEVIYASPGAFDRWIQPEGSEDKPVYDLPVHVAHRDGLERLCDSIVRHTNGNVSYHIRSGLPKPVSGLPPRSKAWVTNVCLRGAYDLVSSARSAILNQTPISLVCNGCNYTRTCIYTDPHSEFPSSISMRLWSHTIFLTDQRPSLRPSLPTSMTPQVSRRPTSSCSRQSLSTTLQASMAIQMLLVTRSSGWSFMAIC